MSEQPKKAVTTDDKKQIDAFIEKAATKRRAEKHARVRSEIETVSAQTVSLTDQAATVRGEMVAIGKRLSVCAKEIKSLESDVATLRDHPDLRTISALKGDLASAQAALTATNKIEALLENFARQTGRL